MLYVIGMLLAVLLIVLQDKLQSRKREALEARVYELEEWKKVTAAADRKANETGAEEHKQTEKERKVENGNTVGVDWRDV